MLTDEEIREELERYEARLRNQYGFRVIQHFKRPEEQPFTRAQRSSVTILFSGLTLSHDHLFKAALESLGYKLQHLPVPDNDALAVGKEYCNRGQCNPTYYTVGTLVRYLQSLRAAGEENIERRYVLLTAGACGPCRFGMYEAEYRKALRDAGFGKFRVILFQQTAGLEQAGKLAEGDAEAGVQVDARFFVTGLRAIIAADIVNAMAYRIRPYEIEEGAADRTLAAAREIIADGFRRGVSTWRSLRRVADEYAGIDVDFTRVKPKVKIIGEFWAQTTEGDASYRIQSWLEAEGAEVVAEPVGTWIDYLLWYAAIESKDRLGILAGARRKLFGLQAASLVYRCFYDYYRSAMRFRTERLASQPRLARYARDYYNVRIVGGEGHEEVGKHILALLEKKAHMVASVKPFGCLPSTQSDGVQSRVTADIPDSIFIPVETSGDSEVSVKSRVQMKLHEAKAKARDEVQHVLEQYGVTLQAVRDHARQHPRLLRPMQRLPRQYVGTAANFAAKVASTM